MTCKLFVATSTMTKGQLWTLVMAVARNFPFETAVICEPHPNKTPQQLYDELRRMDRP